MYSRLEAPLARVKKGWGKKYQASPEFRGMLEGSESLRRQPVPRTTCSEINHSLSIVTAAWYD
jgi:hypothetical protein